MSLNRSLSVLQARFATQNQHNKDQRQSPSAKTFLLGVFGTLGFLASPLVLGLLLVALGFELYRGTFVFRLYRLASISAIGIGTPLLVLKYLSPSCRGFASALFTTFVPICSFVAVLTLLLWLWSGPDVSLERIIRLATNYGIMGIPLVLLGRGRNMLDSDRRKGMFVLASGCVLWLAILLKLLVNS